MHRTASFPIHLVKQPSFFSPGSFTVRILFLASQLPIPDRGDGGAPVRRHTSSQRLRLPQVTSKAYFSSLASSSSRLYHPQGTSSSTGIGLGVDARLEQAFRLLRTK